MATDLEESVMRLMDERNRRENEREFHRFCNELLALPANLEIAPHQNFKADIELQPRRWMGLGMDFLKSRRVTGHVQLAYGVQGPEIRSYLRYPIFQMATEIFLKGMCIHLLLENSQIIPNHDDFVEECLERDFFRLTDCNARATSLRF